MFCACGLEELMLKCLYYPKKSTDPMQSISKFQRHFSQKQNNFKIYTDPQNLEK